MMADIPSDGLELWMKSDTSCDGIADVRYNLLMSDTFYDGLDGGILTEIYYFHDILSKTSLLADLENGRREVYHKRSILPNKFHIFAITRI